MSLISLNNFTGSEVLFCLGEERGARRGKYAGYHTCLSIVIRTLAKRSRLIKIVKINFRLCSPLPLFSLQCCQTISFPDGSRSPSGVALIVTGFPSERGTGVFAEGRRHFQFFC